ncbi:complement receptor type 2-like [Mercenaria mercenaria]|uniref:complement receptor type 2-like n=1 Tax=Mercenaria mercenaria TaxID=6596 RepID=UPI00234ECEF4|nr:complement receptor type 2-like [Mercenaria mercenaria]
MDTAQNSDYESIRDSVMNTYDTLEMTVVNIKNRERSDHKNKAGLTEEDGKFLGKRNKLLKTRICAVVTATVMALFVIALAVMVYVFVSSKNEGKDIETGHCPKYNTSGTVVKTTGSSYGDTIELTCDEKNKLNGPNVITCLSTGNWSAFSQCIPKLCNNFPLSDNMKVESEIENISVGTTVTVNCEEGFVLTGKNTVVCLTNEKWSDNPTCNVIDCEHPDNVSNQLLQISRKLHTTAYSLLNAKKAI